MSHVPLSVTPVNAKDRAARRRHRGHRPSRIALDLTQLHATFHHEPRSVFLACTKRRLEDGHGDGAPTYGNLMPYDLSGNYIESCGDACISVRFAKDTGRGVALPTAAPALCGFGCGGYANGRHGVCSSCIRERNLEDYFVKEENGQDGQEEPDQPAAQPDQQPGGTPQPRQEAPAAVSPEPADDHSGLPPSRLLWPALGASCSCGAVRVVDSQDEAESEARAWGGFVCHCSMCRQVERRTSFGGGVPWVAVPRLRWEGAPLAVRRSSEFGTRGACGACGAELFIQYDCEAHTDWVHADVLRLTSPSSQLRRASDTRGADEGGSWDSGRHRSELSRSCEVSRPSEARDDGGHGDGTALRWQHIHRAASAPPLGDGLPSHEGFEPWEPDPCRPAGTPAPAVCLRCFHLLEPACRCPAPAPAATMPPQPEEESQRPEPGSEASGSCRTAKAPACGGVDYSRLRAEIASSRGAASSKAKPRGGAHRGSGAASKNALQ